MPEKNREARLRVARRLSSITSQRLRRLELSRARRKTSTTTEAIMEAIIRVAIQLAQAQIELGVSLTEAMLGIGDHAASLQTAPPAAHGDQAVERAAEAIQREMLRHKDVGFASLLWTNFPPDDIRRIAQAALQAALHSQQAMSIRSTEGSGQTRAGEPDQSEVERQRGELGPRGISGKPNDAEMTPQQ